MEEEEAEEGGGGLRLAGQNSVWVDNGKKIVDIVAITYLANI